MKKWMPYLIGLMIPVMIFISFIIMIKKRIFVFENQFIKQGEKELALIKNDFEKILSHDVLKKLTYIEAKMESQPDNKTLNLFLKNQTVDSSSIENIFLTDLNLKIINIYGHLDDSETEKIKWAVKNQPQNQSIKFLYHQNKYIFYKKHQDKIIFIKLNPILIYRNLQKIEKDSKVKYPFLGENDFTVLQKNILLNINTDLYKKHQKSFNTALLSLKKFKSIKMKIERARIFHTVVSIRNHNEKIWDFTLMLRISPYDYPLSFWHKIILVITAVFVIMMFILLMIKVKNDSDIQSIADYEENDDFMNRQFLSQEESERLEEEYALEKPLEDETAIGHSEDNEHLEVPDKYYDDDREHKETKNQELSSLIGDVNGHEEETQKFNSLWKNICSIPTQIENKMLLCLKDNEEKQFIPHFKKGLSQEEAPIALPEKNWLVENFLVNKKSLFVDGECLSVTPIKEFLPFESYADIESIFIAPVLNNGDFQGVFMLLSPGRIDESYVREINSLIHMG